MSKALKDFISKAQKNFDLKTKFKAAWAAGSRILPSRTNKNDAAYELRIDAGELISNRYRNLVLQVNSQAKNTALKAWVRKHGTHARLATASFDTQAEDEDAEIQRVLSELKTEAEDKLKVFQSFLIDRPFEEIEMTMLMLAAIFGLQHYHEYRGL